ncbi:mycothiol system anti-sigma-R factor [Corynebacterium durum]|mgnify:FL=1|jgi:mycothiol system anti-sigma-R factor|uniref:mycothiol system anti-sigma-R factor n=1 Tax=Corynebacterium durum TaxID=61592 RepID=UPI0026DD0759|nr:mycothiol system anti-sigma-R factor [Corynebacterium durum]MDO4652773.1 mycothiol system anti-sigma-R factor [Corynebacterium durum]
MSTGAESCHCGCDDVYRSVFELLDTADELTPQRRGELQHIFDTCPHCFEKLGLEQEVRAMLRRCCSTTAPKALRERITISIRVTRTDG